MWYYLGVHGILLYFLFQKYLILIFTYSFIWLHRVLVAACGIYFPDQGLILGPFALGGQRLSLWATREDPTILD